MQNNKTEANKIKKIEFYSSREGKMCVWGGGGALRLSTAALRCITEQAAIMMQIYVAIILFS